MAYSFLPAFFLSLQSHAFAGAKNEFFASIILINNAILSARMKKSNPQITELINYLYASAEKHDAGIWKAIAKKLEKPSRNWAEVNIGKIAKHLNEGEIALVTGKVLGDGMVSKIEVAALSFSEQARKKIEEAGGKCYSLKEIVDKNPKGKGIRIIGG